MITAREARAITEKRNDPEFYWLNRVQRKIKDVSGDGFYSCVAKIHDTQFLENKDLHTIVQMKVVAAGFKCAMTSAEDCVTYEIGWEHD